MEKRVPMDEFQDDSSHFNLFVNLGNLLFLGSFFVAKSQTEF